MLILSVIDKVNKIDEDTLKIYFTDKSHITATRTDGVVDIDEQCIGHGFWSNVISCDDIETYWDLLMQMSYIVKKEVIV